MVKRKEVKIDEEQIRRVMAGDIPASVLENRYGDNAAGSKREGDKETEDSGISAGEEATSPVIREKARHSGSF